MKTLTIPRDASAAQRKIMLKRIQRALMLMLKRSDRTKT
jgi:hypothetical protein